MIACNCTLPYINPNACKNCGNNRSFSEFNLQWYETILPFVNYKKVTYEYDENGKIKMVTVE